MNIKDRPARLIAAIPLADTHTEAVRIAGYSESTATKQPKRTIQTALETMAARSLDGNHEAAALLESVGVSREEVEKLYKELAFNSKNDGVRLQAGKPLFSKVLGLKWEEEAAKPSAPPINIGIINTAQPSHDTASVEVTPPVILTEDTKE